MYFITSSFIADEGQKFKPVHPIALLDVAMRKEAAQKEILTETTDFKGALTARRERAMR